MSQLLKKSFEANNEQVTITKWLGLKPQTGKMPASYGYIGIIKGRIPTKAVSAFIKKINIPRTTVARIIHVSERTLQRNLPEKRLDIDSSEKLLGLARLFYKGFDVFGEEKKFNTWLNRKNRALGGNKPLELLDTTIGTELVADELIRIEHDVLS